jgi:hypothetical protein
MMAGEWRRTRKKMIDVRVNRNLKDYSKVSDGEFVM